MDIKNDFKTGVKLATDAATDIAQALVEKSRLKAKANRIKQVIKSDSELRNQAYIELGRFFYDNMRENANEECEALCIVIDKTTNRINKASRKYLELISNSGEVKFSSENTDKLKKMVTDKAEKIKDSTSEKVKDIKDKAKEKATDLSEKAKIKAQDFSAKAKETVGDISDKAKDKVDDFKAFIGPDEDIEEFIDNDDILEEAPKAEDLNEPVKETLNPEVVVSNPDEDDEESPEEFEF